MPKILLDKDYFNYCEDVYATFQDIPAGTPYTFGLEGVFTVTGATTPSPGLKAHLFHVDETIPKGTYTLWIQVQGYETVKLTISIGLPPPEQPVLIVDSTELPIPAGATHVFIGDFVLAPFAQITERLLNSLKDAINAIKSVIGAEALAIYAVGSKLVIFFKELSPIEPLTAVVAIAIVFGICFAAWKLSEVVANQTRQAELNLKTVQEVTETQKTLLDTATKLYEEGKLTQDQYLQIVKTIQEKVPTVPTTTEDWTAFFKNFLPTMMGVMAATLIVDVFKAIRR